MAVRVTGVPAFAWLADAVNVVVVLTGALFTTTVTGFDVEAAKETLPA